MKQREGMVDMAALELKAVVFDCFGVMYTDSQRSLLDVADKDQVSELADIFMSNNYGYFSKEEYLERIATTLQMTVDQVREYIAHEHVLNTDLVTFIDEQLKGRFKVGLLSNIGREWIDSFFSRHQLHDLFDEVVLSGEEGMTKPHPEIFRLMAARLNLDTWDCLMIDDIADNCEGAIDAGMSAIRYETNRQLFDKLHELGVTKH